MTDKIYQYLVTFDTREMISMPADKVPSEEEALKQLQQMLLAKGEDSSILGWRVTQVIEMNEDGETEYLVYNGNKWVRREEMECNG